MTTLYIIRHAEAEGNLYRRIHGWYNSLITDNGYRQIAALKERFDRIHVDAVYASDLFRTMTTARAVYEPKHLPLVTLPGLREVGMGEWEDCTWGEVARFDGEQYQRYIACDPRWKNKGGESRQEAQQRIYETVLSIAGRHPDETVAIFSHGDAIRALQARLLGLSIGEMHTLRHSDNTGVTCLEIEGEEVRMALQSDNSHLSQEISTLARQRWWKERGDAMADANAWFRPLDMDRQEDSAFYQRLRERAWSDLYGDLRGYDGAGFAWEAAEQAKENAACLWCAMLEDQPAGVLQLDLNRGAEDRAGYIQFFALDEPFQGKAVAPQLLGQAVSIFRPLGREKLRLVCAPGNGRAQIFYRRHGFEKAGVQPGSHGALDLMEKDISYRPRKIFPGKSETRGLL